jgi:hypothetical protein
MAMKEFNVSIQRPDEFGMNTYVRLEMPATRSELNDALQKARITDARNCSLRLLECKQAWLKPYISNSANLYEMNLLAARLGQIPNEIKIYEMMVKMEAARTGGDPIPLSRLINITHSADHCLIFKNIFSDAQLGEFLYENDRLSDADKDIIASRINQGRPVHGMLAQFGRELRETTGGILTVSGCYVEWDGAINDAYIPGQTEYFPRPGASVVLELSKNGQTAELDLPIVKNGFLQTVKDELGVNDIAECQYRCLDCLIPAAKEWIDKSRDIEMMVEFGDALERLEREDGIIQYKALLETAECGDLDTALRLTEGMEEYRIDTECPSLADYAQDELEKLLPPDKAAILFKYANIDNTLGRALLIQNNGAYTSYGLLSRKDGGPILSQTDAPVTGMGMCVEIRP